MSHTYYPINTVSKAAFQYNIGVFSKGANNFCCLYDHKLHVDG